MRLCQRAVSKVYFNFYFCFEKNIYFLQFDNNVAKIDLGRFIIINKNYE